jgi:hypothetical protein
MKIAALTILPAMAAATILGGCSPEGFDVEPCVSASTIGFRIKDIDGWFRNYKPRPSKVLVKRAEGPGSAYPGVWSTMLEYRSDRDTGYDNRPSRALILYGQKMHGWSIDKAPETLRMGERYEVTIGDGGRMGWTRFVVGAALPTC